MGPILCSTGLAYLFKCCVSELKHIHHTNNLSSLIHDREIQVMSIYKLNMHLSASVPLKTIGIDIELTMHFSESSLNAHVGWSKVWVRGHDTNDATRRRV